MTTNEETPRDPLVRREEEAAAAEAGRIGGRAPEYEDDDGLRADDELRPLTEGGEGDAVAGEPDELDVTETVRDPSTGRDDPSQGLGTSHDR